MNDRTRMRATLLAVSLLAWSEVEAAPAGAELRIDNAAMRLRVIPEARTDVSVQVPNGAGITVQRAGGSALVDGGVKAGGVNIMGMAFGGVRCEGANVALPGKGPVAAASLPLVVARVPYATRIVATGAVFGEVGPSSSLSLSAMGCGRWTVASVNGAAEVTAAGAPIIAMGKAARGLSVNAKGASRLTATEVNYGLTVSTEGAAVVDVARGLVGRAELSLKGSGLINFGGEAGSVDTAVNGSGDIKVGLVNGTAQSATRGTGGTYIGRAKGKKFCPPDCG